MKHARRTPGVANVFERHELGPQALGRRPVAIGAGHQEFAAQTRRDAAGTGRHPAELEVAKMHDRRPFAHAGDDAATVDTLEESVEHRVLARILPDDRVLDRDRDAVIDQAADRVERLLLVGPKAVFRLQIDDERHARGVGNLAHADLDARGVARIAARQHHRGGEGVATKQAGLIERSPERRTEARDRPPWRRKSGQPVEQRFVLGERDVIEKRVAAVEEARDAAVGDVPGDAVRRRRGRGCAGCRPCAAAAARHRRPTDLRDRQSRASRWCLSDDGLCRPWPGSTCMARDCPWLRILRCPWLRIAQPGHSSRRPGRYP